MMESSSKAGLTTIFDDATNTITFEWDEETHPQYNYIKELTPETFSVMLQQYLGDLNDDSNPGQTGNDHAPL